MNNSEVEQIISNLQVVEQIPQTGLSKIIQVQRSSTLPIYMDAVNKFAVYSEEERRIREELELDIERDLEEEIKEGMRCLARRLQMLYKHKEERRKDDDTQKSSNVFTELSVMIKLDGKCKIEICEAKPSVLSMARSYSTKSEAKEKKLPLRRSKFDWSKSLRSGTGFEGETWNNDGISGDSSMCGFQKVARRRKWCDTRSEDGKLHEEKNNK